jgi:hypothetical protein
MAHHLSLPSPLAPIPDPSDERGPAPARPTPDPPASQDPPAGPTPYPSGEPEPPPARSVPLAEAVGATVQQDGEPRPTAEPRRPARWSKLLPTTTSAATNGVGFAGDAPDEGLLTGWLPTAPAEVLDVGGGAGVYALWLAQLGCAVDLVDPVQKHVDQQLDTPPFGARGYSPPHADSPAHAAPRGGPGVRVGSGLSGLLTTWAVHRRAACRPPGCAVGTPSP